MRAPSFSIISEIFLQSMEQNHLPTIAKKHNLTNYFRYVDDILIVYDTQQTDLTSLLADFISLHPKLLFTKENEQNNQLNYLDITIHRQQTKIKISIYRKPTYTDSIIPFTSNHPTQQKYAAIRFLQNRLNAYNLQTDEIRKEENIIRNILYNNAFQLQTQPANKHPTRTQTKTQIHISPTRLTPQTQQSTDTKKHWCTFIYTGRETAYITKLFKHTNVRIAFRTNNNIWKHLSQPPPVQDKYKQSGVYKLTCPDCGKAYIGQTGREFRTRINEHKRAFHHNPQQSKLALHLTDHKHSFGHIDNIMKIIQPPQKTDI
jgi:hypothetical protein